jgi:hypothetical protein
VKASLDMSLEKMIFFDRRLKELIAFKEKFGHYRAFFTHITPSGYGVRRLEFPTERLKRREDGVFTNYLMPILSASTTWVLILVSGKFSLGTIVLTSWLHSRKKSGTARCLMPQDMNTIH